MTWLLYNNTKKKTTERSHGKKSTRNTVKKYKNDTQLQQATV